MPELLTLALVAEVIAELQLHFPGKRASQDTKRLAVSYHDALAGISGEALRHATRRAVQDDQYFPKVSRLRELATAYEGFQRRENFKSREASADVCESCGTRYHYDQDRWRPVVGKHPNGEPDYRAWLASDDGEWLLLARYERMVCGCSAPSAFMPTPGTDPAAVKLWKNARLAMPVKRSDVVIGVHLDREHR